VSADNVRHLPSSDHAIRILHAEIERLASEASAAYITRTPVRVEQGSQQEQIEFWHDDNDLKVLTAGDSRGVHISGTLRMATWPDWYALTGAQARRIANALLSAAAYVDTGEDS
jgi:hypothetical protein